MKKQASNALGPFTNVDNNKIFNLRTSLEYLTEQVTHIDTQIKGLHRKIEDSPTDLQEQLQSFLLEAEQEVVDLRFALQNVHDLSKQTADYFCEDSDSFNLNACLSELFGFFLEYEKAIKVRERRNDSLLNVSNLGKQAASDTGSRGKEERRTKTQPVKEN